MSLRRIALAAAGAAALLAAAPPAAAQWGPSYAAVKGMDESFRIDFGGFFQKFDTKLNFYTNDGTPTREFSLEDMLGQSDHSTNFRMDGIWRFGRHGSLHFAYRGWSRSADRVLTEDIQIGDDVYRVGAQTSSRLRQNVGQVFYGYSFVNNGEMELGTMLGVAAYFNSFEISASTSVSGGGGGGSAVAQNEAKNFVAPFPAIGAYFRFTLLPKFFVFAKVTGLPKITVSDYSASMIDVVGGLDIYFTNNFGIGGGYEYVNITIDHPVSKGYRLEQSYSGPLAYLTLAF